MRPLLLLLAWRGVALADAAVPAPRPPAGSPPLVTVEPDRLVLRDHIYFDSSKATIKPLSLPLIDAIAAALRANPWIEVLAIQVHSEERGNDDYNLRLTEGRAQAVRDALIARAILPARLTARGYGETQPLCREHNQACWARNRRTELRVARAASLPEGRPTGSP
jgi:OmpA-OmpF porin, OOP family